MFEASFGVVYSLALVKVVPGLGRLVYIVRGPGVVTMTQFEEITELIKTSELPRAFAVKCEPPIHRSEKPLELPTAVVATRPIQPNVNTVYVDLTPVEEDIIATFRQRARREIKAAKKEGVEIRAVEVTEETIDQMYALYAETARRAGFFCDQKSTMLGFGESFRPMVQASCFLRMAKMTLTQWRVRLFAIVAQRLFIRMAVRVDLG